VVRRAVWAVQLQSVLPVKAPRSWLRTSMSKGGASTVRQCEENGGRAVFQRADVAAEADVEALIGRAVSEFGRLDITFNNAGLIGAVGPLEAITAESWYRTHAILLRGVFFGIKYSIPQMRKGGGGSIISTASIARMQGGFGPTIYSAAKAGVINLTHCAAIELGQDRIRVNCICPGGINTPIGGPTTDRSVQALSQAQPIRRAGRPEDIANMALFLASDESEWITGTAMLVDGGFMARAQAFGSFSALEWSGLGRIRRTIVPAALMPGIHLPKRVIGQSKATE